MTEATKLIDEIKQIIDITSRVDERVKMIAESQQEINFRLNHFIDEHNALAARVHVIESNNGYKIQEAVSLLDEKLMRNSARLEIIETVGSQKSQQLDTEMTNAVLDLRSRVKGLEDHKQSTTERFRSIMSYIWQGAFIITLCYILYRLGLSLPPVP